MRQRTPPSIAYAWWRRAVALLPAELERHEGHPEAGYYRMKVKRQWVPVEIWIESVTDPHTLELTEPERMRCRANGAEADPERIWTSCDPISKAAYETLIHALSLSDEARMLP